MLDDSDDLVISRSNWAQVVLRSQQRFGSKGTENGVILSGGHGCLCETWDSVARSVLLMCGWYQSASWLLSKKDDTDENGKRWSNRRIQRELPLFLYNFGDINQHSWMLDVVGDGPPVILGVWALDQYLSPLKILTTERSKRLDRCFPSASQWQEAARLRERERKLNRMLSTSNFPRIWSNFNATFVARMWWSKVLAILVKARDAGWFDQICLPWYWYKWWSLL